MTYQGYGRVIKGVGGLFTVRVFCSSDERQPLDGHTVFARGRGSLHRKGALLVGDLVQISYDDTSYRRTESGEVIPSEEGTAISIDNIQERSNALIRPPMANLDYMLITAAAAKPDPSLLAIKLNDGNAL